ncbi:MAG: hypothetical protein ACOC2U_01765 [bacterium]
MVKKYYIVTKNDDKKIPFLNRGQKYDFGLRKSTHMIRVQYKTPNGLECSKHFSVNLPNNWSKEQLSTFLKNFCDKYKETLWPNCLDFGNRDKERGASHYITILSIIDGKSKGFSIKAHNYSNDQVLDVLKDLLTGGTKR